MARYIHKGRSIDYTPQADIAAGEVVVIGDLIGVAKVPIAANVLGALAVDGVFDFAKTAGAGTAITAGTKLYWDAVAGVVATTTGVGGANKQIGYAVAAAGDSAALVRAMISRA